jgi:peptidyl-prolyl cis-trans isomerase C
MKIDIRFLAREPLLYFILAGFAVFALNAGLSGARTKEARTITVTQTDLERMAALYTAEAGRPPNETDVAAMVADHVRDEALSREALRLGLEADDTIIKRRLAQKMSFMIDDLAEQKAPSESDLRAWHASHPESFSEPQRLTFSHVFISRDTHGPGADAVAEALREDLNTGSLSDWQSAGDPFMLAREYGDVPAREIARTFGIEFANTLSGLPAGDAWRGPVASGLGLHLVRIAKNAPPALAPFESVRDRVAADYSDAQTREANEAEISKLIAAYTVEIEGAP